MDKTLDYKLEDFKKALDTLKAALDEEQTDFVKDSVIKRFEYCYELCWKTSKVFLSVKHGIEIYSPKECFRELRRNKYLSDEETEVMLKLVNDRNEIIHNYDENFADKLYKKIVKSYYKLLNKVFKALNK